VANILSFNVSFAGLDWVPNFENTRWFLVLRIQRPESNELNKLLHVCNVVVQEHGQPPLYSKPIFKESDSTQHTPLGKRRTVDSNALSTWKNVEDLSAAFHISIAWTLTAPSPELLELTKSVKHDHFNEIEQVLVAVNEIKAKVGNIVTNMPLPKSISLGKSLFGV
jgi:hypothetical protein